MYFLTKIDIASASVLITMSSLPLFRFRLTSYDPESMTRSTRYDKVICLRGSRTWAVKDDGEYAVITAVAPFENPYYAMSHDLSTCAVDIDMYFSAVDQHGAINVDVANIFTIMPRDVKTGVTQQRASAGVGMTADNCTATIYTADRKNGGKVITTIELCIPAKIYRRIADDLRASYLGHEAIYTIAEAIDNETSRHPNV